METPVRLAWRPLAPEFSSGQLGRSVVSDLFERRRIRSQPTFHGRVSTNRADTGFQNYLNLTADNQKVHIFLDGVEQHAVTADPDTGIVEIYYGAQLVTLRGNVEIKLERD